MKTYALAADMGGTNTRVSLTDRDGLICQSHAFPTKSRLGRDVVLDHLLSEIENIARSNASLSIVGIGVSVASPVDPDNGVLHNPPNLPGWDGYPLRQVLEERLSITTTVMNDANAAALAEHRYGAGRGYKNMVYITVSTGIGGGIIVDGELYVGSRGFAGEIGHIRVAQTGLLCNCGNVGCLELFASGTAAARMARERISSGEGNDLLKWAKGDPSKIDAGIVAEAAASGNIVAHSIMDEVASNLEIGIVNIVNLLDPDIIVVGGGMAKNLEMLLPRIRRPGKPHDPVHHYNNTPVVKSELGGEGGLMGAAAMAFSVYDTTGIS